MARVSENQYEPPTNTRPRPSPSIAPPRPKRLPTTTRRPAMPASRTAVLIWFLSIASSSTPGRGRRFPARGPSPVEIAGVDVQAGHALGPEHLQVTAVVLERQAQVEAIAAEVGDRPPFELPGGRVVPEVPHDEQVPEQLVAPEPGDGLRLHAHGPGGQEQDLQLRVEQL